MKRHGAKIHKYRLKDALKTGIDVESLIPGLIPEFFERSACKSAGYRYDLEWQEMTMQQKAAVIAHYTLENIIENHVKAAENDAIERRSKG